LTPINCFTLIDLVSSYELYDRYKIEIDVSYESEKATFVLWDREVNQLMGVSAAQLRHNMIQVHQFAFSYQLYLTMVLFYQHSYGLGGWH
jgi:hypothetical protein